MSVLARNAVASLRADLLRVRRLHTADSSTDGGFVQPPGALAKKIPPAPRAWEWQWVFPASRVYTDSVTGEVRRHHLHETAVQRAVGEAARRAQLGRDNVRPVGALRQLDSGGKRGGNVIACS